MIKEKHLKNLAASGIDAAYAKRMRIQSRGPNFDIPYLDLDGKPTGFKRTRLSGAQRYTQAKDSGIHLYLPPWPKGSKRSWRRIASDPKFDIYITEGEKKAACMVRNGLACIGIGGIDSFKVTAEWAYFNLSGRTLIFIPDADYVAKRQIRRAVCEAIEYFNQLGATVEVLLLPPGSDKTGVDDYIQAKGIKAFNALVPLASDTKTINDWQTEAFKFPFPKLTLANFPVAHLIKKPPSPEYVWLILKGAAGSIVGSTSIGKSFLSMGLAVATSLGKPYFGVPTVAGGGRVVYLAAEDAINVVHSRIYDIFKHMCPSATDLDRQKLSENLIVESLSDPIHLLVMNKGAVVMSPAVQELTENVARLSPVLLVLDPQSRFHGLEENSPTVATVFVQAVGVICNGASCTAMVPHHTGISAERSKHADPNSGRGSSGFGAGWRSVVNLYQLTPDEAKKEFVIPTDFRGDILRLTHAKNSAGKKLPPAYIHRMENGVLEPLDLDRRDVTGDYDGWLVKLRSWAAGTPFSRRSVVKNAEAIDKLTGRIVAEKYLDIAIKSAVLAEVPGKRRDQPLYKFTGTH